MKILVVRTGATVVDPSTYNLQEIGLARALTRKGHQCGIVYYTDGEARDEEFPAGDGLITLYWRHARVIAGDALFDGIMDLVAQYDVIQVSEYDRLQSVRLYRTRKNVVVYHGPYEMPLEFTHGVLHRAKSLLFDMLYTRKDRNSSVVALAKSDLAASRLREKGFASVEAVGVGLDLEAIPENKQAIKTTAKYNLISVGRFDKNKNQLFLLDVYERCLREIDDLNLFVIGRGNGSYAEMVLGRMQDKCFNDKITYVPSVSQCDISAYYLAADLLVLPSIYEIFGMVLLEASLYGCPFVTSENGGSITLSKSCDFGAILRGFDVDEWAHAICGLLLDESKRKVLSDGLRRHILANWTWDAIADKFLAAYERAVWNE